MIPIIMAAAQAGGSLLSAHGQAQNLKLEADNLEWQAGQVQRYARKQSEMVAKQGRYAEGAAAVGVQQSGFAASSGTTDLLMAELSKNIQSDIFQTVLSGDLQAISMRAGAAQAKIAASSAMYMGLLGAGASAYQGYQAGSQYQTARDNLAKTKADMAGKKSILGG